MFRRILRTLDSTHMHVVGSSGYGKSKFLQALLGEAYFARYGFCLIDWHGTLFRDLLNGLGFQRKTSRPIYLLDLAEKEFITPYNPFAGGDGEVSELVASRIAATTKAWGAQNTDETPLLGRVLRALYTFAAEENETLPNAKLLLQYDYLRKYAAKVTRDWYVKDEWKMLASLSESQFRSDSSSTHNRLDRFLAPLSIRRIIGRRTGNIDIGKIIDEGGILLVNLHARSAAMEAGRTLGALLLTDFLQAALSRTVAPVRPFLLCLDEFQEYATPDVASMLDQVRKAGLHLVLCHQRLGQLARDEELDDAVANEAQMKAVFGGLRYETAASLAQDMMLGIINERQIKEQYHRTIAKHELQMIDVPSYSTTQARGTALLTGESGREDSEHPWLTRSETMTDGMSRSDGLTAQPILIPYYEQEKTSDAEWSRDEKVSRAAEDLMSLQKRACYLKFPGSDALHFKVRVVREHRLKPAAQRDYERAIYRRMAAMTAPELDQHMAHLREDFLHRASDAMKRNDEPGTNMKRPR
jgi:hypothetical protein